MRPPSMGTHTLGQFEGFECVRKCVPVEVKNEDRERPTGGLTECARPRRLPVLREEFLRFPSPVRWTMNRAGTRCSVDDRPLCQVCAGTGDQVSSVHFTETEPSRAALGLAPLAIRPKGSKRKCAGCGVPVDERTPGCVQCRERHAKRRRANRKASDLMPRVVLGRGSRTISGWQPPGRMLPSEGPRTECALRTLKE